jgi:hypothetical protein
MTKMDTLRCESTINPEICSLLNSQLHDCKVHAAKASSFARSHKLEIIGFERDPREHELT